MSKLALVTGGSAGIGLAAAKQLSNSGFDLVLISSNAKKLANARERLLHSGARSVATEVVDFADLRAVAKFAARFDRPWDALVNNAGIKIQADAQPTRQGFERHLGINHLAHFALTDGLLCRASANARVVTVASIVARVGSTTPLDATNASTSQRYANSKLANLAFALELDSRLKAAGSNVRSLAAHPGFTKADPYGTRVTRIGETLLAQHCDRGAAPIVDCIINDDPYNYVGPSVFELWGSASQARIPLTALDEAWRGQLWRDSEVLVRDALAL
jgi:NAD(P)-dependent dehydrogenase (short-subunit alcohol dehydrogenase family)